MLTRETEKGRAGYGVPHSGNSESRRRRARRSRVFHETIDDLLLAAIWLVGPAAAETVRYALPAVPDDPADDRACLALYGRYQAVVDELRAAAVDCTGGYPVYARTRYGHWFGAAGCRR